MIYYLQKKRCVSWTHAETFGSLGKGTVSAPPFSAVSGPLSIWHGGLPTALSQDANGFSASEKNVTVMAPWCHGEIKVPKGGHLKTDPVEKECDILHKSSYVAVGRKVWSSKGPNFGLIQPLQLLTPPSNSAFCGQRCRSYQRFAVYRCHTGICLNCTCSKDHLNEVMNDRENQKTPSSLDGKKKGIPGIFL